MYLESFRGHARIKKKRSASAFYIFDLEAVYREVDCHHVASVKMQRRGQGASATQRFARLCVCTYCTSALTSSVTAILHSYPPTHIFLEVILSLSCCLLSSLCLSQAVTSGSCLPSSASSNISERPSMCWSEKTPKTCTHTKKKLKTQKCHLNKLSHHSGGVN